MPEEGAEKRSERVPTGLAARDCILSGYVDWSTPVKSTCRYTLVSEVCWSKRLSRSARSASERE